MTPPPLKRSAWPLFHSFFFEPFPFSGSVCKARVQCIPSSTLADQAATVEGQMNIRHFSLLVFSSRSRTPFYMIRPPIAWDTALHCVSKVQSCHFCDGQSDFLPRVFRHHPVSIFGFFFCSESCIYCNDKYFPRPLLKLFWDEIDWESHFMIGLF